MPRSPCWRVALADAAAHRRGRQGLRRARVVRRRATHGHHAARGAEAWHGGSAIDGRTTRHAGYGVSHRRRKLVEQAFGWMKTVALLRKLRHRGGRSSLGIFTFSAAAYNLVRWRNLTAQQAYEPRRPIDDPSHRSDRITITDEGTPVMDRGFSAAC